ncbi:hypothetical protein HY339_02765 [Candidatus Gottesmanbacteria bacterium]|nr:hypothetical protein [Candidatus Gottesmanbacteria bacterium]
MKYRKLKIVDGGNVLFLFGVLIDEPGEGLFVVDRTEGEIREGGDFLAQFSEDTDDATIVEWIKNNGLSSHLNPEYR